MIPSWIKNKLDEKGKEAIEKAIAHAEKLSDAEIVPLIVKKSIDSNIANKISILAVLLIMIVLILLVKIDQFNLFLSLTLAVITLTLIKIKASIMKQSVESRATKEFLNLNLHNTAQGTGVLVFVSLLEQKIVILCDTKHSNKLNSLDWEEVSSLFIKTIRESNNLAKSLSSAISLTGEKLSVVLPLTNPNKNELPNTLVIKD